MGWNQTSNKSLQDVETKVLSVGAPVAYTSGVAGRPYKDGWNIERAYKDGVAKITWVFRAIDAIAGNQAKLPILLREGNTATGKVVEGGEKLLHVLNSVSNMGESSFAFRYRLSSQLLMSTRGVFIEVVRNHAGEVDTLHLLPPQDTAPIPHPTKFVSGFEVDMPNGGTKTLKPEDVIWIRRPHPLDPYRSITPMEASGVAIEIEQLAKLYNRNFLINDGRPGGLLVLRGDIEDDDREELATRFRGNLRTAGSVSVIASEDGADFVDLGSSPRDIAYQQMRAVTKEEILAAFGVPESVIGNASGRCLRRTELVRLADGSRVEAIKLVGESFSLMTATPNGHVEVDAWATLERHEPIYRTTTESGRVLETNAKHPLFAARYVRTKDMGWRSENGPGLLDRGWVPVGELTTNHVVAVPSRIAPTALSGGLTLDEAFVLGALVGDRAMTGDGKPVGLATPESEFSTAFVNAVRRLGDDVALDQYGERVDFWRVRAMPENQKGSGRGAVNSVKTRVLLRRVGLMGTTSHTKFVPEEVFSAPIGVVSAFLSGYFAADGHVSARNGSHPKAPRASTVSVTTVSERLSRDVQELLLRLGVNARIRTKQGKGGLESMGDQIFSSFEISFSAADDIVNFTDHVAIPGKPTGEVLRMAKEVMAKRPHGGNVHTWRTRDLSPDLRWEKVKSVEVIETDDTVGIAVPEHHTYLSTFWEHNTFSNAAEEGKVFWQETMSPHLELISRSLDRLDESRYVDFDTSSVPIIILSKQESEAFLMQEFSNGLISANEYRDRTGREVVVSELADGLLANPSLTPIGNTEKPMETGQPEGAPAVEGAAPGADQAGLPIEVTQNNIPVMDSSQNPEIFGDEGGTEQLADVSGGAKAETAIEVKASAALSTKAEEDISKWEEIVENAVGEFFVRQHRVVMEKARSKKVGRAIDDGTLTAGMLFDSAVWDRQLDDDLRPIVGQIMVDAADAVSVKAEDLDSEDVNVFVDEQLERSKSINDTTKGEIATAVMVALSLKDESGKRSSKSSKVAFLILALGAIYVVKHRKKAIAEDQAQVAYNSGLYLSGTKSGAKSWTWNTRGDDRVRSSHRILDGKTVPVGQGFALDGKTLRFPGDPLASADLTIGCRCRLTFN